MSAVLMRWWATRISLAAVVLSVPACEPPPAEPPPKPAARRRAEPAPEAATAAGPASAVAPTAEPQAQNATPQTTLPGEASAPIRTRKTIGKTTFAVLDLADAVAQGGVKLDDAGSSGGGGGLLGATAQAYRHSVSTIGGLQVEQKMKLYEAEHGSLPATHKEFMARIIAPGTADEIRLPTLPYYQEYAFDPETRGLVVVEFPARKEQRERETTGAAGL
jgi:hypothetical protein